MIVPDYVAFSPETTTCSRIAQPLRLYGPGGHSVPEATEFPRFLHVSAASFPIKAIALVLG